MSNDPNYTPAHVLNDQLNNGQDIVQLPRQGARRQINYNQYMDIDPDHDSDDMSISADN